MKEAALRMARSMLEQAEDAGEFVKSWWRLLQGQALDFDWLVEIAAHAEWDRKDFARAWERNAGKYRYRALKMVTEHFTLGQLGESYAALMRLGFWFTTDIRETLTDRFREEPELEECVRARKALEERRTVPWPIFRE
jgi:hypothetical protein